MTNAHKACQQDSIRQKAELDDIATAVTTAAVVKEALDTCQRDSMRQKQEISHITAGENSEMSAS